MKHPGRFVNLSGVCRRTSGLQPFERLRPLFAGEDLDLGMREVLRYGGGDLQEGVVRNGGDAVNVAVVIVHELQMFDERAEAVPSGEGRRLDKQTGQFAFLTDVGVDRVRDFAEIIRRKGACRFDY